MGYWDNVGNGVLATKWLIEDVLHLSDEEIKEQLCAKLFIDNKLGGMLACCFEYSPYRAIQATYPNKFKPSDFKVMPKNYWTKDKIVEELKHLIIEKFNGDDDKIRELINQKFFIDNNLGFALSKFFNGSPYKAIDHIFPGKFKPWEFKSTPKGYWEIKENRCSAIKWLISEELQLSVEELKEQLTINLFTQNGLGGVIANYYDNNPFKAIEEAYPNELNPWDIRVPCGYWNDDNNKIGAIKWLIEEKLKLSNEELKEKLSVSIFEENKLNGLLKHHFKGSPYLAIDFAYPNKFKKEDFKNYVYYKIEK